MFHFEHLAAHFAGEQEVRRVSLSVAREVAPVVEFPVADPACVLSFAGGV